MKGDRKRTPILNREVEARTRGNSDVVTYTLSKEELAKYQALPVPTDQKRPRVNLPSDEPATISPEKQRERAQKSHDNRIALEPAKEEFLREIAKGKTIADIERERGMSKNSLYYWVKKWDLIGINPGKARQLLSEEDETMGKTLTKDIYLQHRLEGKNRTSILKEYFGDTGTTQFYMLLKSWGIKEKEAEEQAMDLLQAVKRGAVRREPAAPEPKPVQAEAASQQPVMSAEDVRVTDPLEEIARLNKKIESLKANNVEAVRLSGSASEKQQAEIKRLTDDNAELQRELQEAYDEIKALVTQIEKTVDAEMAEVEDTSMDERLLGKIEYAEFGQYPDMPHLFGLQLGFTFPGSGVTDGGSYTVNISPECRWEASERADAIVSMLDRVNSVLKAAKADHVSGLIGKPVEVLLENKTFKDFRILTEVL